MVKRVPLDLPTMVLPSDEVSKYFFKNLKNRTKMKNHRAPRPLPPLPPPAAPSPPAAPLPPQQIFAWPPADERGIIVQLQRLRERQQQQKGSPGVSERSLDNVTARRRTRAGVLDVLSNVVVE